MSDPVKRNLSGMLQHMAAEEIDPGKQLADLEAAQRLTPEDQALANLISGIRANAATGLTYVAINDAHIIGPDDTPLDGQIFVRRVDGTLTPITGGELAEFATRYRDFAKRWRLRED